jgi:hypothetical protein
MIFMLTTGKDHRITKRHRKGMLKKANFQFSSHLNVVVEPPHYPVVMVAMLEIVFGGEW